MSAFGGKADMTGCGCLLSRSLLGVKRTWPFAAQMSANDRTPLSLRQVEVVTSVREPQGGGNEAARVHSIDWRCGGCMAADSACAAARADAAHRRAPEYRRE